MQAPNFNLPDQRGAMHSLADYAGRWLVLYFYPEDDTPGCTVEACSFRDERDVIVEAGNAEVVGISKDPVESHKAFAAKYNLTFTLLSDTSHDVLKAYNSWDGTTALRNTYIINPAGQVVKEYRAVVPQGHVTQIIRDLKELQANA